MDDFIDDNMLIEHITEKSKQKPKDIFELNDGRIIVNGNLFINRAAFNKILKKAKRNIKIDNFFRQCCFGKTESNISSSFLNTIYLINYQTKITLKIKSLKPNLTEFSPIKPLINALL